MTVQELADKLGVNRGTLAKRLRDESIPSVRHGQYVRVPVEVMGAEAVFDAFGFERTKLG